MLFLMFITFFTSRVVLDKLGIVDFGIQNVVGGLASMFSFFRSSMSNATQRFLSIALGKNDLNLANKIFSQHQTLYICVTILLVFVAEFVGIWLLKNILKIPSGRENAAFWVFQFSLLSLAATILTIVYDSVLIARENMKVFSYIGIIEGISKLVIAYVITIISFDHLITYSFLLMLVSVGVLIFYAIYCSLHFAESHYHCIWDKSSAKDTFSFISWNIVGTAIYAINDQGVNVLLNMFFGPVINAARGISFQVSQALTHFSNNFYTAVRPQIMKSYASGDISYLFKLLYSSSKFSVFLLWYLSLPVMLCIDPILAIWLKKVPDFTNFFTIWVLLYSLVNSLTNPIWSLALAIGKLKWYIIIGSGVSLLTFPISYIALEMGFSPVSVFIIAFLVRLIYVVVVIFIIKRYINFSFCIYLNKVIIPVTIVMILSSFPCIVLRKYIADSFMGTIQVVLISSIFISIAIWIFGLEKGEKKYLLSFIKK